MDTSTKRVSRWARTGGDVRQHVGHHLGLDAQKNKVGTAGDGLIVRHAALQLFRQSLGLFHGAVGEKHLVAGHAPARSPGQCPAHIAGSDESKSSHSFTFLFI